LHKHILYGYVAYSAHMTSGIWTSSVVIDIHVCCNIV